MPDDHAFLHISHHSINRYWERILHRPGTVEDRTLLREIEAEIFCLLQRCQFPQIPRYVVTVARARFMIVEGVVVTTLEPGMRAWIGVYRPDHKIEVHHHAQ